VTTWVNPDRRPCAFQEWAATDTKLPWWAWYRYAAQERLCRGPKCAWCPRTRFGRPQQVRIEANRST
jgi:hypothetical protein